MKPCPSIPLFMRSTRGCGSELSRKYQAAVILATVPEQEWDAMVSHGFDAIWFMGVWERSPAGIAIAMRNKGLLEDSGAPSPIFRPEDNVGSPYCVRRYVVDQHLGGPEGLAAARRLSRSPASIFCSISCRTMWRLTTRGSSITLNTSSGEMKKTLRENPASFMRPVRKVCACGRDPYFPAWPDVLQLNAFHAGCVRR